MRTSHGSIARLVGRRLRHSLESTHWSGVLAVSLGQVRNGDDRLEVRVIQLLPCPVCLDLQHHERICLTSDPDGLRGVVGLYLNILSISSDDVISTSHCVSFGQIFTISTPYPLNESRSFPKMSSTTFFV